MPRKSLRRRRSSKKAKRRPKSKKMRGGVTVRAQDLTRLNRDVFGEIREFHPLLTPKLNNITLRQAIKDYLSDDFYRKRYVLYRYGEIEDWDVSNVKNMKEMFMDSSSFNQPLNNWNVSNVRDMKEMFSQATSFNQPLNKWNVSNVEYMGGMFYDASSFNQPLNNWNVSSVYVGLSESDEESDSE